MIKSESKGDSIDIRWKESIGPPIFDLEMQDINEEEWKKFIANLRGLIDSIKT